MKIYIYTEYLLEITIHLNTSATSITDQNRHQLSVTCLSIFCQFFEVGIFDKKSSMDKLLISLYEDSLKYYKKTWFQFL